MSSLQFYLISFILVLSLEVNAAPFSENASSDPSRTSAAVSADARIALETAYKLAPDNLEVLKRVAASRDAYTDQAALIYEALAKKLESENANPSEVVEVLKRGLVVALRDGETASALRISESLRLHGKAVSLPIRPASEPSTTATVEIPGGMKALAQVAGIQNPKKADTFLVQYAERLVRLHDKIDYAIWLQTIRNLHEYFKIVTELQSLSGDGKHALEIRLDSRNQSKLQAAEKALSLLGWQVKKRHNRWVMESQDWQVLGPRKKLAEALGVNGDQLKRTLEANKPFVVNLSTDRVDVLISEKYWYEGLLNGLKKPGGIAEALLNSLPAAYLYIALSRLTEEAQVQIIQSINPKALVKDYSKSLYLYGGALSIEKSQVRVPGGDQAIKAWEHLVGADHRKVSSFLNALLSKDDGKLLAFYYILAGLPSVNQELFTRDSHQLEAYYQSFAFPGKGSQNVATFLRKNTIFQDVTREMPLNEQGDIVFPGGSAVWTVHHADNHKPDQASAQDAKNDAAIKKIPAVHTMSQLKGVERTGTAAFPSIGALNPKPEGGTDPSAQHDPIRKMEGRGNDPFPSVGTLKKLSVRENDPFPSIGYLKRVEVKEVYPASTKDRPKAIEEEQASVFPPLNPLKKENVQETDPTPMTASQKEQERQRRAETKILTELFASRDEAGRLIPTRLEAFLTVVRLEKHWGRPLDEASVSLLLEQYLTHKNIFPYLPSLPPLTTNQLRQLFRAIKNLDSFKSPEIGLIVGDFQCLLKLLSLLYENEAIKESQAKSLFDELCGQFAEATSESGFVRSSFLLLEHIRQTLESSLASTELEKENFDVLLLRALTGSSKVVPAKLSHDEIKIDISGWKRSRMEEVLALQVIPSTDRLLKLYELLQRLGKENQETTGTLQSADHSITDMRDVDETLWESVPKNFRQRMIRTNREKIQRSFSALKVSIGKGESVSSRESLIDNVILELHSSVHLSLLGWIYAYHFSPEDLLIKEDPLFVRRHQFLRTFASGVTLWNSSEIDSLDPDSGSYIRGGVAQIAALAGEVGLVSAKAEEAIGRDEGGSKLAAAQLAALRAIPWGRWDSHQIHDICILIRLGRELLTQARLNSSMLAEISDDLRVLAGPTRYQLFLRSISEPSFFDLTHLLSSQEFFTLALEYWKKKGPAGWKGSPLAVESSQEGILQSTRSIWWARGYFPQSYGCGHPRESLIGPYEEYENVMQPDLISERLSHVFLDLAEKIDRAGLPLELLPLLAEPAVHQLARTKWMNDWSDWQAALEGLQNLKIEPLVSRLEKNP